MFHLSIRAQNTCTISVTHIDISATHIYLYTIFISTLSLSPHLPNNNCQRNKNNDYFTLADILEMSEQNILV